MWTAISALAHRRHGCRQMWPEQWRLTAHATMHSHIRSFHLQSFSHGLICWPSNSNQLKEIKLIWKQSIVWCLTNANVPEASGASVCDAGSLFRLLQMLTVVLSLETITNSQSPRIKRHDPTPKKTRYRLKLVGSTWFLFIFIVVFILAPYDPFVDWIQKTHQQQQ